VAQAKVIKLLLAPSTLAAASLQLLANVLKRVGVACWVLSVVRACVLIYCKPGEYLDVLGKLNGMEGVREAFPVHGRCDLIAIVEALDYPELSVVTAKINAIDGIQRTETLVEA